MGKRTNFSSRWDRTLEHPARRRDSYPVGYDGIDIYSTNLSFSRFSPLEIAQKSFSIYTVDSRFNDSQGTGVNLSLNRIIVKSNVVSVQNVHINDDRDRTKLSLNRAFR